MDDGRLKYQAMYDISVLLGVQSIVFQGTQLFSSEQTETPIGEEMFRISTLTMSAHAGTHLDAPAHLKDYQKTLDQYQLQNFVLPALVINIADQKAIRVAELENVDINRGDALLFRTENSVTGLSVNPEPSDQYVYMSIEAADLCAEKAVGLVGFDYFVSEKPGDQWAPIHRRLFDQNILILEGANLKDVPEGRYTLFCLPLKMKGLEGSPVRAVLLQ